MKAICLPFIIWTLLICKGVPCVCAAAARLQRMLLSRCNKLAALPPVLGSSWLCNPSRLSLRYCGLQVRTPHSAVVEAVSFVLGWAESQRLPNFHMHTRFRMHPAPCIAHSSASSVGELWFTFTFEAYIRITAPCNTVYLSALSDCFTSSRGFPHSSPVRMLSIYSQCKSVCAEPAQGTLPGGLEGAGPGGELLPRDPSGPGSCPAADPPGPVLQPGAAGRLPGRAHLEAAPAAAHPGSQQSQ